MQVEFNDGCDLLWMNLMIEISIENHKHSFMMDVSYDG